jgi:hypothetical protein
MSSDDQYRLIWSIVLLCAIVVLYLMHVPEVLIAPLFTLFPRDLRHLGGKGDRPASRRRVEGPRQ